MKHYIQLLIILVFLLVLALIFLIPNDLKTTIISKIQIDTIGHIIGFFGLTWILVGLMKLPLINTVICLFFYSALTELSQYYLGFRSGEFFDFVADVVGISFFAVLQWIFVLYQHPKGIKR
ncbi:MAG: VanZ family protein [Colwellia sp.]|jgi:VanZ family protein